MGSIVVLEVFRVFRFIFYFFSLIRRSISVVGLVNREFKRREEGGRGVVFRVCFFGFFRVVGVV